MEHVGAPISNGEPSVENDPMEEKGMDTGQKDFQEKELAEVTYQIRFNSWGGTEVKSQMVDAGSCAIKPEDPTKDGYETGGGSEIESQSVYAGGKAWEPFSPVREGYAFLGWYENVQGTKAWDFKKGVTENITLYANWRIDCLIRTGESKLVELNKNGREDMIRVEMKSEEDVTYLNQWGKAGYQNTLSIYLNDRKAYECQIGTKYRPASAEVWVTNVDTQKDTSDIFVEMWDDDYAGEIFILDYCICENGIFLKKQDLKQYLDKVLADFEFTSEFGPYHTNFHLTGNYRSSGLLFTKGNNKLDVTICGDSKQLVFFHGSYTLTGQNGQLIKSVNEIQGNILETCTSGTLIARKSFYTEANGSQIAFNAEAGEKVDILAYKCVGHSLYIQVRNSKGETGWMNDSDEIVFNRWDSGTLHVM